VEETIETELSHVKYTGPTTVTVTLSPSTDIKKATMTTATARERILATAGPLFYEHGFRAVGIDTIIEQSGVAKMSLYRNFATKDELIVEYLRAANEAFWSVAQPLLDDLNVEPVQRLERFFDAMQTIATRVGCHGCTFTIASSDFPDRNHPAHLVALEHKRRIVTEFSRVLKVGRFANPTEIAEQLLLVLDGAWVSARMFGPRGPSRRTAAAARAILATGERLA
jgi:AcrR family transcriptional regulator